MIEKMLYENIENQHPFNYLQGFFMMELLKHYYGMFTSVPLFIANSKAIKQLKDNSSKILNIINHQPEKRNKKYHFFFEYPIFHVKTDNIETDANIIIADFEDYIKTHKIYDVLKSINFYGKNKTFDDRRLTQLICGNLEILINKRIEELQSPQSL